jgi:hypothetical protein
MMADHPVAIEISIPVIEALAAVVSPVRGFEPLTHVLRRHRNS